MSKKKVTITVDLEIEFNAYTTQRKNIRAAKHLRKWVEDTVKELVGNDSIPLYIEKDENGSAIEEYATGTKANVKLTGLYNT